MWYDTMGRDGNPLGRLRHTEITHGYVAELHDRTVLTNGARIDLFEWTDDRDEADIPREVTIGGETRRGGWVRVADQQYETYDEALTDWHAYHVEDYPEVLGE